MSVLVFLSRKRELGHVDKRSDSELCGGEIEETHEGQGGLVVSGRDASHLL